MSAGDIANINTALDNIQEGLNLYTGNTLINYNQINTIVSKQNTTLNSIYGGSGNIYIGNLSLGSNIKCTGLSTGSSSQAPFRIEYGTTATVNTTTSINFSQAFTTAPTVVITGFISSAAAPSHYIRTITTSNVWIYAKDEFNADYGNIQFTWMAIGV
jgi:hypothetical protein